MRKQWCIPMFTSLEGSYSSLEGWMLPRRHTTPWRLTLFSPLRYYHEDDSQPLAVDLKGGHQTLINSMRVITMVDSSLKNSYLPSCLQPPRVTRSMGMLKTCSKHDFIWLKDGEGLDLSRGERSDKNSQESLWDLRFGVRESEREHLCSYEWLEWSGQPSHVGVRGYL